MEVRAVQCQVRRRQHEGFALMESVVAAAVVGVVFAALLSGLAMSVTHVQFGREEIRATQIMVEKLDTIRMYRWDRINAAYIPATFTETYNPSSTQSTYPNGTGTSPSMAYAEVVQGPSSGTANLTYAGAIQVMDPGLAENYAGNVKQIVISLQWQSGGRTVRRQMTTFVTKYGLQLYVP